MLIGIMILPEEKGSRWYLSVRVCSRIDEQSRVDLNYYSHLAEQNLQWFRNNVFFKVTPLLCRNLITVDMIRFPVLELTAVTEV